MVTSNAHQASTTQGKVVVANRVTGNLTLIDEQLGTVLDILTLPVDIDGTLAEPTYIISLNSTTEIAVTDRTSSQVFFLNSETFEVTGAAPTGEGNFHLWQDPKETQIWVVNDISDSLTVIDPRNQSVITDILLPPSLIGENASPHDVLVDPEGNFAYVTIFQDESSPTDLLLKIDTQTFQVVDQVNTGKHSHIALVPENNLIYVLSEENNQIQIFDRRGTGLTRVGGFDQPGAHGTITSPDGRYVYTTNISGEGDNAIFTIDTVSNELVGDTDGVDVPFPIPHNLTINSDRDRLYLSHSGGTSNAITTLTLDEPTTPVWDTSVNGQGLNPFGLTYIPAAEDELFVEGKGADQVRAGNGNDTVFGGRGKDTLRGESGNDKLFGERGNDRLKGGAGDDVLIGGIGRDTVDGGAGDDVLIGSDVSSFTPGQGVRDRYRGGEGNDTFVLGDALTVHYDDGNVNALGFRDFGDIRDFTEGEDIIRLHGSAELYELGQFGRNTVILYQGDGTSSEVIGVIRNTSGLDLTSVSFEYATV